MQREIQRRQKFWINPYFQRTFILYTSFVGVITLLVFLCANVYFFWRFTKFGREIGLPENHNFFYFLYEQEVLMSSVFLLTAVFVLGISIFYGVYWSHRIAGPIARVQSHLRQWTDGVSPEPLRFRKKDYFHELADSVDQCLRMAESPRLKSSLPKSTKSRKKVEQTSVTNAKRTSRTNKKKAS